MGRRSAGRAEERDQSGAHVARLYGHVEVAVAEDEDEGPPGGRGKAPGNARRRANLWGEHGIQWRTCV